jgi:hypothetical protein
MLKLALGNCFFAPADLKNDRFQSLQPAQLDLSAGMYSQAPAWSHSDFPIVSASTSAGSALALF